MAPKKDITDEVNGIITEFHSIIFRIIKLCRKIEPDMVELESLQNKIGIARDLDPLIIITRCKDKLWYYREEIIAKNEDFFINNKFGEFIKNDENKPFMYTIVNLIKAGYKNMSENEKTIVWNLIQALLKTVIEYKKATNDYV